MPVVLGELVDHGRVDIVGPIVDVDDPLLAPAPRPDRCRTSPQQQGDDSFTTHASAHAAASLSRQDLSAFGRQAGGLPGENSAGQMANRKVYPVPAPPMHAVTDRRPGAAGKHHLPAFRVGDRRRIEARQRHHDRVRIALDLDLVRFAHVDEAACGLRSVRARRPPARQIVDAGITPDGSAMPSSCSFRSACHAGKRNKSRGTIGESRETFAPARHATGRLPKYVALETWLVIDRLAVDAAGA